MIVILVQSHAVAGRAPELLGHIARIAGLSRAQDGNVGYDFYLGVEQPDAICTVERWADSESLELHRAAPHVAEYITATKDLIVTRNVLVHKTETTRPANSAAER